MKELSIEEKAKRYDEAIAKGKQIQNTPYTAHWDTMKEVAEHLLPELKESEDERMMNQLHSWMKEFGGAEEYTEKVYQWIKGLLKKQRKNNMGISEATKQKLEDNLNKALEQETLDSWNEFLEGEQKPTWSEEDEDILNTIINHFKVDIGCADEDDMVRWLKSLKERVLPQNIAHYNPYKEVVESIAEMCEKYKLPTSNLSDFLDNVKVKCKDAKEYDSLFSQNRWKPSESDILLLERIAYGKSNPQDFQASLGCLIEQLKKLMGE